MVVITIISFLEISIPQYPLLFHPLSTTTHVLHARFATNKVTPPWIALCLSRSPTTCQTYCKSIPTTCFLACSNNLDLRLWRYQSLHPDINNLPDCSSYTDSQQVSVGNGQQLPISNIGNAQLYTFSYLFNLKKLLHVPSMASHLLSVNRFCRDNNCAFYFDADLFRIQDRPTGKPLYIGLNKDGLYPIHGLSLPPRPSLSRCNLAIPNLSPSS